MEHEEGLQEWDSTQELEVSLIFHPCRHHKMIMKQKDDVVVVAEVQAL